MSGIYGATNSSQTLPVSALSITSRLLSQSWANQTVGYPKGVSQLDKKPLWGESLSPAPSRRWSRMVVKAPALGAWPGCRPGARRLTSLCLSRLSLKWGS